MQVVGVGGVSYSPPELTPTLNEPSLSWRSSPSTAFGHVPSALTKSTWSMSCGLESMYQTKQLYVPQVELPVFDLPIRTPWPGAKESEPICCTASSV